MGSYLLIKSTPSSRNLRVFLSASSSFGVFWAKSARSHSAGAMTSMFDKLRYSVTFRSLRELLGTMMAFELACRSNVTSGNDHEASL